MPFVCSLASTVKLLKGPMRNGSHPYRIHRWFCLCTIIALTACSIGTPSSIAPYQPQGQFSVSGKEVLPDRWWLTFADPVLDQLIETALSDNLSLQTAWDRLDQARAVARRTGAELWPQLDGEAVGRTTGSRTGSHDESRNDFSLGLSASYEIDLWGRINSTREAAELDAVASAEALQTAALTLTARVASTWFKLIEQREQIMLLERQLSTNRQTLELVTLQFRTGQVGIADLLQQRLVVENRRGELVLAAAQEQVLFNQLAVLLGLPPDQAPQLTQPALGGLPPLPDTGLQSELIERRPDVRAAWLQIQAADQRVAAAVADRFPRLSLTGRTTTASEEIEDLFNDWLSTLAANLLAPVVDGGRRRAEVDRTRAAAAAALHSYGQTVLEALAEVEDALVLEERQLEYLDSLDLQLELAAQATERIRDRYLNGAVDYQRVLTSILSEQQLQLTRLTARGALFENRVNLCRALAGGWKMSR